MRFFLPQLTLQQKLSEFDSWITSTLGEIKDSDKFRTETNQIANAIEVLGTRNDDISLGLEKALTWTDELEAEVIWEELEPYEQREKVAELIAREVMKLLEDADASQS